MHSLRRGKRIASSAVQLAASSRRPGSLGYLGWIGEGNLGDEAVLIGQQHNFPDRGLMVVPNHDSELVMRSAVKILRTRLPQEVLVGGGTLIGRPEWLARLNCFLAASPNSEVRCWGAGVEDPDFSGTREHVTPASLRAWSDVLRTVKNVGVRGPRSAEILSDLGVEAVVVGDPALAMSPSERSHGRGVVAINIGAVEDTYASDPSAEAWTSGLVEGLLKRGLAVKPFAMTVGDVTQLNNHFAQFNGRISPVSVFSHPGQLLDWLAKSDYVVSQRLHGAVLAAAASVPFLAIDYRPKCRDFCMSLDMPEASVRTSEVTSGEVLERVDADLAQWDMRSDAISEAVAELRRRMSMQP